MKTKLFLLAMASLVVSAFMFSACGGDDPVDPITADGIVLTPTALSFNSSGGTQYVKVESKGKWTAKSSNETVATLGSVKGGNGGEGVSEDIVINVQPNSTTKARTAEITVTSGAAKATVTISQEASDLQSTDDHNVEAFPYLNAGNYADQATLAGADDYVARCNAPGSHQGDELIYLVNIKEEGDLTITTGDNSLKIYIVANAEDAEQCIWVAEKAPEETKNTVLKVHLTPLKDAAARYIVILTPSEVLDADGEIIIDKPDGADLEYSIRMDFVPRKIEQGPDENGVLIAGTMWAKYNSKYEGGKTVFDKGDGDALYQWNRKEPVSASNWSDPSADDYATRTHVGLENPTNVPCPDGWRLPTNAEFTTLIGEGHTLAEAGQKGTGIYGGRFIGPDSESATVANPKQSIFVPFVGFIDGNKSVGFSSYEDALAEGLLEVGTMAQLRSSDIQYTDGPYWLVVSKEETTIKGKAAYLGLTEEWARPWRAQSIRCVKVIE
jgi:uncharacterized protein (TIGR02145 family)